MFVWFCAVEFLIGGTAEQLNHTKLSNIYNLIKHPLLKMHLSAAFFCAGIVVKKKKPESLRANFFN